ncbi:circadian clock-controlled protein daywake-like [Pieris napi]|uniref:circadian clock-controlled protein daywake-like n=1 Tax=Pieris napi TaxID=78633 RepID=UPI001FBB9EDD|nr:circadian clock-controlled protein daywake-like [Pieris napi]
MIDLKYFVVILAFAAYTNGVPLVAKCKVGDSKCSKESAQAAIKTFAAGIPEFQIKSLDPLVIKHTDASSPNLKLTLTDYTVTGLKDCIVKKTKYDKSNSKLLIKLQCSPKVEGSYEMNGQLLILRMEGKGPIHVQLRKAEFSVEYSIEESEKDGAKYWNIKDYKHSFELKDKADVVFGNLFNGNDVLGQAAKEVIKESGNEIVEEVGSPVISDIIKEITKNINTFFHQVPISELIIE